MAHGETGAQSGEGSELRRFRHGREEPSRLQGFLGPSFLRAVPAPGSCSAQQASVYHHTALHLPVSAQGCENLVLSPRSLCQQLGDRSCQQWRKEGRGKCPEADLGFRPDLRHRLFHLGQLAPELLPQEPCSSCLFVGGRCDPGMTMFPYETLKLGSG